MPESFTNDCSCDPAPGTVAPSIAPYVVSIEGLQGIIDLGNTGAITWRTEGNTIYADFTASAGLGSVTSVAIASSTSNLVVVSGSPITTSGTITLNLAGNIGSIAGLVMAADQMLYSTAANTFAATSLTAFARTILDDASAAAVRTTLGLVIGTNVQAWSADLDAFVTNVVWSGTQLSMTDGYIELFDTTGSATSQYRAISNNVAFSGNFFYAQNSIGSEFRVDPSTNVSATGTITSTGGFSGPGGSISALNGTNISSGTVGVTVGGTGLIVYAVGDIVYANTTTSLARLADVSSGSYLRSGGVNTAPLWSTLKLPNSATTGDLLFANASNTISNLADVATGNALISGGVGVAPAWGKITTSHTTGIAASGANADISSLSALGSISSQVLFTDEIELQSAIRDNASSTGSSGMLLTAGSGGGVVWSNQITLDTITINTRTSVEGTLTAGGTTGNQTINKPSGTVRFAAGATAITVTNNLCTTSDRVLACACTNDATAYVKNVVTTSGAFTITLGAAATAETEVYWQLYRVS